jgi:hypothetical protein
MVMHVACADYYVVCNVWQVGKPDCCFTAPGTRTEGGVWPKSYVYT